jgi:hypothetical protein
MNGIALPSSPSALVATSVLLTLRCVLEATSTGDVLGVGPVPDTVLKNWTVLSLVVIWGIMSWHLVNTPVLIREVRCRDKVLTIRLWGGNHGESFDVFRSHWDLRGTFVPRSPAQSLELLADVRGTSTMGSNEEGLFHCSCQRVAFVNAYSCFCLYFV